jgi:hypothetical protein
MGWNNSLYAKLNIVWDLQAIVPMELRSCEQFVATRTAVNQLEEIDMRISVII